MRFLALTCDRLPGFEDRNLPLVRELLRRGHDVVHAVPGPELRGQGFTQVPFDPGFAHSDAALNTNTRVFGSWEELADMVDRSEIVLSGMAKDYQDIAAYAAKEGKLVLYHRDGAGPNFWAPHPHRIAIRGAAELAGTATYATLPRSDLVVTGCVQFDKAAPAGQRLHREAFCLKYRLPAENRIVVYAPPAPGAHTEVLKDQYRRICNTIAALPAFNIVIKPHPRDFVQYRQHFFYQDTATPSWRQLAPDVPACEPEDTYDCLRHAEVLITQNSSMYMEAALFRKPMLEVAIPESRAFQIGVSLDEIARVASPRRFAAPGRRPWTYWGCLDNSFDTLPEGRLKTGLSELMAHFRQDYRTFTPEYIGSECSLEELGEVLQSRAYAIDNDTLFDDYVRDFCHANDGAAYIRVADMAEAVAVDPAFVRKIVPPTGLPLVKSKAKSLGRRIWRRTMRLPRRVGGC